MSETLLDKSVYNYNAAVVLYESVNDDEEYYLNFVAYHLQQSVEMAIKFLMEKENVDYPRIHDIDQLILFAEQNNVDLHLTEYIDDHREMFSLWESKTRYVLDFQLSKNRVEVALSEVNEYITNIQELEVQVEYNGSQFDNEER